MPFSGQKNFQHQKSGKIGVLLTNLGTPDEPTPKALRRYLKEFLSDRRVVEIPRVIWWLILNGPILNTRPKKSAALYKSVWTDDGSPLLSITRKQAAAVEQQLKQSLGLQSDRLDLRFAMRYGNPSIASVANDMLNNGVDKLLVIPLYPQYSGSTSGSTMDAISRLTNQLRWVPNIRFLSSYHDNPDYIQACANKIKNYWQENGKPEKLVLSYHGIPKFFVDNGDPYFCHCHKTTRLIVEALGLNEPEYIMTFQSRFGKAEWLQPYTDKTLESLPAQGIKKVDIFCPGFSTDCLETLEEIEEENREYFIKAGGEQYRYITALNDDKDHINAITGLVINNLQGWLNLSSQTVTETLDQDKMQSEYQNHLASKS